MHKTLAITRPIVSPRSRTDPSPQLQPTSPPQNQHHGSRVPVRRRQIHHAPPQSPCPLCLPLRRLSPSGKLCIRLLRHLPPLQPPGLGASELLQASDIHGYFCRNCGTRMLHSVPNKNVISIKAGCIQGLDWTKAIHIWAKNAMVPIPEGSESYTYGPPSSRNSCAAYSSPGSSSEGSYDQPDELMGNGSCHVEDGHESTK
ncbi:hypothetical protein V2G26_011847 [Clonostachys chloroleuca]